MGDKSKRVERTRVEGGVGDKSKRVESTRVEGGVGDKKEQTHRERVVWKTPESSVQRTTGWPAACRPAKWWST